jgi:hypothetical protein
LVAVGIGRDILGSTSERLAVIAGGADGDVDHRHHLFDLTHDLAADGVDALAEAHGRQMRVVDALDLLVGERGLAGDEVVDGLVEVGIVAGRVGVPDLEIARMRA